MTVKAHADSLHGFMVTPDPYEWLPDFMDEREVHHKLPEGLHAQASDLRARRSVNPRADGITGSHAAVAGGSSSVGNELYVVLQGRPPDGCGRCAEQSFESHFEGITAHWDHRR